MTIIIITDSRGTELQSKLNLMECGEEIMVLVHRGAGYKRAVVKSIKAIREHNPTIVILMVGICDITIRNWHTKRTALRYTETSDIVKSVMDEANTALRILKPLGDFKLSLATVTGIDLADYNNLNRRKMTPQQYETHCLTDKIDHPDQTKLNMAIIEVNRQLTAINKKNGVPTTWMAGLVHSYFKGKYHHYYKRLADGCHADDRTKIAWARQLSKSIIAIKRTTRGNSLTEQ